MAARYTKEFRRDAAPIATTSGLTRPQAAALVAEIRICFEVDCLMRETV